MSGPFERYTDPNAGRTVQVGCDASCCLDRRAKTPAGQPLQRAAGTGTNFRLAAYRLLLTE